jgi:hypothetical protein
MDKTREALKQNDHDFLSTRFLFFWKYYLPPKRHRFKKTGKLQRIFD